MTSIRTIAQTEKDPAKVNAAVRQLVEKLNGTTGLTDGDKGDITVSAIGATWTIDANAVTTSKIADSNVTTAKIADSNVTTAKIADDNVTNTKLANMDQSTIKGRAAGAGTGDPTDLTATQATAILNAFTDALKGLVPASGGGTANFLRADGTFAAPPAGAVLQVLQTTYTSNVDLTTALPLDDTTPTSSEGAEVLSLAITPSDNTNKVLVHVHLWGSATGNSAIALFRGTTCINACNWDTLATGSPASGGMEFLDSPASASAQTYSVRVGTTGGATMRLNGTTTARWFGGASACTLTLSEIAA